MSLYKGAAVQGMRGRYRIESLVGTGGLGRVWRAKSADGREVAIKEPLREGPQEQVTVNFEKLRVESVVLERLTGERPMLMSRPEEGYDLNQQVWNQIVRFIDVDRMSMPTALVLEFLEGRSVDVIFRSAGSPNYSLVDEYVARILIIVKGLHENNIIHRDISPRNLIVTSELDRNPVLIDFGTVKERFNQVTGAQWSQIVTPGYSAPELAVGLASPCSDIYSIAATILYMYCGKNPQYLRNSAGDLDETRNSELRMVPEERFQVLRRALSYHPADRYQTVDDLTQALAGKLTPLLMPHIVASGRKIPIKGTIVLGRLHTHCHEDCRRKGFSKRPDIAINDPGNYIGRHHAKVRVGANGEHFIEDLHAVSGTALRRSFATTYERLRPGKEYPLQDGDVIALAYSPTKGPYMTVSYHAA